MSCVPSRTANLFSSCLGNPWQVGLAQGHMTDSERTNVAFQCLHYWIKVYARLDENYYLAQYHLGVLLTSESVFGLPYAPQRAYNLFLSASKKGIPGAAAAFGEAILRGEGTLRDMVRAVVWLQKAANQGDEHAKRICEYNFDLSFTDLVISRKTPKDAKADSPGGNILGMPDLANGRAYLLTDLSL